MIPFDFESDKGKVRVMKAGFPGNRDASLGVSVDPSCNPRGYLDGAIAHDCAAAPGDSGGPIMRRNESGKLEIIALITSASERWKTLDAYTHDKANWAITVSLLRSRLTKFFPHFADSELVKREVGNVGFCDGPASPSLMSQMVKNLMNFSRGNFVGCQFDTSTRTYELKYMVKGAVRVFKVNSGATAVLSIH